VLFTWLSPCSLELSLIERYWRHLKDLARANVLPLNLQATVQAMERIVAGKNSPKARLSSTFPRSFSDLLTQIRPK
jgi:hypothetical protein